MELEIKKLNALRKYTGEFLFEYAPAEDLNLALSSLRYRIKKMREFFPDASRQMMMETVEYYLPVKALERAVALKRNLMC